MGTPEPNESGSHPVRRAVVVLAVVALFVTSTFTAYRLGRDGAPGIIDVPVTGGSGLTTPDELDPVLELYREINSEAVRDPDSDALVEGAKQGMVEALEDPYARYYDPEQYAAFNQELGGVYSGVGMELEETADGLFIVTVFPGSPAEATGLEARDQIVGVDGRDVRDESIETVVPDIRGDEGTDVTLEVERDGDVLTFDVTRAQIDIPLLQAEMLEGDVGHVRMFQFTEGVGDDLRAEVEELRAEGAKGFVLDLRGNPGGLLREAAQVASVFLEEKVVVRVVARGGQEEVLETSGEGLTDVPLVVLIDEGTASASEIVAGAMRDHDRAELIGETTFGKGTVQTVTSLDDGSGAKFTTAEYLLPSGESIEGVGVKPDREVADEDEQLSTAAERLRSEIARAAP